MINLSTSRDAVAFVLRENIDIQTVRVFRFSTKTKLQQRRQDFSSYEKASIERALDRKIKEGVRFWEALLGGLIKEQQSSKGLLAEIFYHQPNKDYQYLERAAFEDFELESSEDGIALNSKVLMKDGSARHLALLDFKVQSKVINHQLVEDCILMLGLRGFLVDSGKSYHFIGADMMTESALLDLLAKFALLHPVSDVAWAAHQLLERSASLRVSARNRKMPSIIRKVGMV